MRLRFPLKGVNKGLATIAENPQHTPNSQNVRAFDTLGGRIRGAQRDPLRKWGDGDQVGDTEQPVVEMVVIQALR
jgi:hypothetical protein